MANAHGFVLRVTCRLGLVTALALTVATPKAPGASQVRVWERVSPAVKHGADIDPHPLRTRASADGNRVAFTSAIGFGDVQGGALLSEYIALRDEHGHWATHAISPEQEPTAFTDTLLASFEPRYLDEFSRDLSHGVYLTKSPLAPIANTRQAANLYLRTDLTRPGPGSYMLLSDADSEQSAFAITRPWLAGSAQDYSRIYFESQLDLTSNSVGLPEPSDDCLSHGGLLGGTPCDGTTPKLYEWVGGSVRLVGILPDGSPSLSEAGQGAELTGYSLGTVSSDGTRAVFTAPPFDGSRHGGALYVRDDEGTVGVEDDVTTSLVVSERTDCSGDPSCGGDGLPDLAPDPTNSGGLTRPATYWAASSDASVIFFTSSEQLTDDDPNHSSDLYRSDWSEPFGQRLTRVSVDDEPADNFDGMVSNGHTVSGVLGASDDGAYVYFTVSQGQLISGGRTGATGGSVDGQRIFVWHEGSLREVGAINGGEELNRILGSPRGWTTQAAKWSRVTQDGRHMAFVTQGTAELLSLYGQAEYDHGEGCDQGGGFTSSACLEVYVFDAVANGNQGDLACASCNYTRARATTNADFYAFTTPGYVGSGSAHLTHTMTDDGRIVFFNSAERLDPKDENDANDAYEYDTLKHVSRLVSAGTGTGDSVFLDASADGRDVFFTTRDRLVPSDIDQNRDLYDARIGGLAEVPAVEPRLCTGEACKELTTAKVEVSTPSSAVSRGRNRVERSGDGAVFWVRPLSQAQRLALAHGRRAMLSIRVSRPGTVDVRVREVSRHSVIGRRHINRRVGGRALRVPVLLGKGAVRALARGQRVQVRVTVVYSHSSRPQILRVTLGK